jgi:hypothetical protein
VKLETCAAVALVLLCGNPRLGLRASAAPRPQLAGSWKLNRQLSEFPREVAFDADWQDTSGAGGGGAGRSGRSGGGRGGGRGSGGAQSVGAPSFGRRFESEADSKNVQQLVDEVKNPPERLTISQTDAAITIEAGAKTRTFHPTGKEDQVALDAGPVAMFTTWQGNALLIRLQAEQDRELRYRRSRDAAEPRLLIEAQLAQRGRGETIKRIYDLVAEREP